MLLLYNFSFSDDRRYNIANGIQYSRYLYVYTTVMLRTNYVSMEEKNQFYDLFNTRESRMYINVYAHYVTAQEVQIGLYLVIIITHSFET